MAEIVIALDLPSVSEALALADRLPGLRWAKVGPTLFVEDGPRIVRELKERGTRVFLDLKWHDIPHAVAGAVRAAAAAGVDLATVHALGGAEMLRAAGQAAGRGGMRLAAVTVLTSHAAADYAAAVDRPGAVDLGDEVARLATLARDSGLGGVVCAAREAPRARAVLGPDAWIVVPGIRPPGADAGDQARVAEPGAAVRAGATHLVIGRPVTGAPDPPAAYASLLGAVA